MWRSLAALSVVLLTSGCVSRSPLIGLIYTDVESATLVTAQANMKTGEACASSILGLIATGDASMGRAAKNAGIISIGAVDERNMSILGLYSQHCSIVHGK